MKKSFYTCICLCFLTFCTAEGYFYGYTGDGTVPPSPEWAHDAVFYSINVQHFGKPDTPGSYFEKAAAELEYIKELGANAVVLNPAQSFAAGEDPRYWNAYSRKAHTISDVYGGGEKYKQFVQHAHSLGLKVVQDVVIRWLWAEGPEATEILGNGNHHWFFPGWTQQELETPFEGDSVGVYNPAQGRFRFLSLDVNSENNLKDFVFQNQGGITTKPVIGDWDGDKRDSIGVWRYGNFTLTNIHTPGIISQVDYNFSFGPAADHITPVAGDWDGDGKDGVGVYDNSTGSFYLRNSLDSGQADIVITGQGSGLVPLTGDWNGDGRDQVGEYSQQTGYFYHYNSAGSLYIPPYRYGGAGTSTPAVAGDWDGDGSSGIAIIQTDSERDRFLYKNTLSGGNADSYYDLSLYEGYDYRVVGNFDYGAQRTPVKVIGKFYDLKWDDPDLQEYMIDKWVNLIREYDIDGFRLDLEAHQTVLVPFGNQNVWKRVIQRCYDEFGKKFLTISEHDGMGNNNIHAEQDSYGVFTNLHWDPRGENRNFMVNANIVDTAKTLENTYYTMTLSCHDHGDFQAKGRRAAFGYMVFSPFMPWWRMGEEVNAVSNAPNFGTGGYGSVLYFSDMDWDAFEDQNKNDFYQDVRRMLSLRAEHKDIISPFVSKFKNRKFTDIPATGCDLQVYATYGSGKAVIVAAKLDELDGNVTLNIGHDKLEELGLAEFEFIAATEKLYKPADTDIVTAEDLENYQVYVKKTDVIFLVLEGSSQNFLESDINLDGYVNMADFAVLADRWQECSNPKDLNCKNFLWQD
jgi:hypothetical protein